MLVVRGEPGVGKTPLLELVVGQLVGFRVACAAGVQSEMELAFAGLHQLCSSMAARVECLPGRTGGAGAVGRGGPRAALLCVVDDAQWLDRASAHALAFAARRLGIESVALIFATRDPQETPEPMRPPVCPKPMRAPY